MTRNVLLLVSFACSILLFTKCDSEGGGRTLPRHSGEPGEILVVMSESSWLGDQGDSLRAYLESYYPSLPQAEPSFSLLQFSTGEMSDLLKQHRNILQVVVGPDAEGINKVTVAKDKWSSDQLVFSIISPDESSFYDLLREEMPKLMRMVNNKEIERTQSRYKRVGNDDLEIKIEDAFGISMLLPADCELVKATSSFMWVKRERVKYLGNTAHDITQGFFIYRYPYEGETSFDQANILSVRDSVLERHVPGPKPKTYMTTEYRFPPESEPTSVGEKYGVITRGLWKTENYFMGGPFMSLTTTNSSDEYAVCISGFVFAPKFDKREYIREVEAVLRSAEIVGAKP
jgi:hypothetical protein